MARKKILLSFKFPSFTLLPDDHYRLSLSRRRSRPRRVVIREHPVYARVNVHRHRARGDERRRRKTEDGRKNEGHGGEGGGGGNRGVKRKKKNRKEERETGREATRTERKRIRGAHD